MEIHRSDEFREKPNKVYVGGQMDHIDDCDVDLMLLIEMDDMASILGYAPYIGYYYRILGMDLHKGIVHMISDEKVLDIEYNLNQNRIAQVYFHHVDGIKLMENHHVDGDVSVDKGKMVASECDELDSEYQPNSESRGLVLLHYQKETKLKGAKLEEVGWSQVAVSQVGGSQIAISQPGGSQTAVIQGGGSQATVSQAGGSQVVMK
ncbi:unnamed protein product [Ilex paraguariensis]|uniref:PB1-like domain-containing protein n=1 Tax=Ilex paraguariensis TaxID=185542 RepID=A0ABC8SN12_9AQUA